MRLVHGRLDEVQVRLTAGRQALIEVLSATTRPLTIAEIAARDVDGSLSISSVYRNMTVLEAAGVAQRIIGVDDTARFELSTAIMGNHHHLLCVGCGIIRDVHLPAGLDRVIAEALGVAARDSGFVPQSHRVDLMGRCAHCADQPAA